MKKEPIAIIFVVFVSLILLTISTSFAQQPFPAPNYDETSVPYFTLPNPLIAEDGSCINTPEEWIVRRRPEILKLFKEHMFGQFPEADLSKVQSKETLSIDKSLGGKATRKEIRIWFNYPEDYPQATILLYLPNHCNDNVPVFVMPNFQGIHSTTDDPTVTVVDVVDRSKNAETDPEAIRGKAKARWAFDTIVSRGYAIATVYYEEIEPDVNCGFTKGVHTIFTNFNQDSDNYPATIGAWAWGLSRVLDALEKIEGIDASKAIIAGHSRLGKASLWCGANDERFAAVISNNSGCGGAALSRREFGERVAQINTSFPHWFTKKFHEYGNNVNDLPIDEHELIALIAPRPVYIASASEDRWADPKGEFLSGLYADPVYRLLGTEGIGSVTEQPEVNVPVGATIRYHLRSGKHDVTDYDWERYLDFADDIFSK